MAQFVFRRIFSGQNADDIKYTKPQVNDNVYYNLYICYYYLFVHNSNSMAASGLQMAPTQEGIFIYSSTEIFNKQKPNE